MLILALILSSNFSIIIYATQNTINEVNNTATEFIAACEENHTITNIIPLYDTDDSIIAYYCKLSPAGYLIISIDFDIPEFSFSTNRIDTTNETIYYGGPLNYYTRNIDESYTNIATETVIESTELDSMCEAFLSIASHDSEEFSIDSGIALASSPSALTLKYSLSSLPVTYTYTAGGTAMCGTIAAAILLEWYDRNVNNELLSDMKTSNSTGIFVIGELKNYVNANGINVGTSGVDVINGIAAFLEGKGSPFKDWRIYYMQLPSYSNFKSQINSGRPCQILVNDEPTYGNH